MVILPEPVPNFDVTTAEGFGEVTYLSPERLSPFRPNNVLQTFRRALDELGYSPATDFICMTGRAVTLAYLMGVIGADYEGKIKILVFDARTSSYKETSVYLEGRATKTAD